ncbi:MAG: restriction endonuclease [Proteobacteria bacterium]|nr:restriction endonuclease [Pseudomonadota bacterium]
MFGNRGGAGPSCHANILQKLDEVRGSIPAEDDIDAIVDRMRLPWLLDEYYVAPRDDEGKEPTGESRNDARLVPFPAARRRKGLTTVTGGYQTLLNILNYCRDGTTREDLTSFVNTEHPRLTERSIRTQINGIANELNCLKLDGNRVVLTEQGRALVESEDPGELMDWLVTRILGADHAMVILRDEKRCTPQGLARRIQEINPGWTTTRTPSVIISRLRELDMLDIDEHHVLSLSDAGKKCAQRIHWQPEALAPLPGKADDVAMLPVVPEPVSMRLPEFADIKLEISKGGHFPVTVIRKLHYGLWANERRHFAVLTGLSGSGKTLLARSYGKAILREAGGSSRHLSIVPVQPGWYDPSALLGYVNPLQGNSYIRTPFLEFLISASEALDRPFTVVLDEMNLSRPEQYLSPILSAMETGEPLTLHREGESFDGVPSDIRYPSNLAIIGTVNMDETTHGISDKVLDRAFTIEFWDVELKAYPRWGTRSYSKEHEDEVRLLLTDLMMSLRPARLHFGWRVVDDVLDYMDRALADNGALDPAVVLDDVVYAKVLPKLRGDDAPRFREALRKSEEVLGKHRLNNCVSKVKELSEDLESTGSARFWR